MLQNTYLNTCGAQLLLLLFFSPTPQKQFCPGSHDGRRKEKGLKWRSQPLPVRDAQWSFILESFPSQPFSFSHPSFYILPFYMFCAVHIYIYVQLLTFYISSHLISLWWSMTIIKIDWILSESGPFPNLIWPFSVSITKTCACQKRPFLFWFQGPVLVTKSWTPSHNLFPTLPWVGKNKKRWMRGRGKNTKKNHWREFSNIKYSPADNDQP